MKNYVSRQLRTVKIITRFIMKVEFQVSIIIESGLGELGSSTSSRKAGFPFGFYHWILNAIYT